MGAQGFISIYPDFPLVFLVINAVFTRTPCIVNTSIVVPAFSSQPQD